MPLTLSPRLMRTLNANGIRKVVVGHTPHGSSPTVIKSGERLGSIEPEEPLNEPPMSPNEPLNEPQ